MTAPLVSVAAVNSLLFASNAYARKLVSPYPDLSIAQVATAGAIAGAVQSILASPVEMFKVRTERSSAMSSLTLPHRVGSNASPVRSESPETARNRS